MTLRILTSLIASSTIILALGACGSEPIAPPVSTDTSLVAPSARVRLATTPEIFEVAANDAERLEFTAPSLPGPSRVTITLGEIETAGINIFERVEQQLASFNELPSGSSFGQTQLVAPIGLIFMLRGRFEEDDREVEELRAILVHPVGNRLLTISYRYPAGNDTAERGQQLMELLGEIEDLKPQNVPPDS